MSKDNIGEFEKRGRRIFALCGRGYADEAIDIVKQADARIAELEKELSDLRKFFDDLQAKHYTVIADKSALEKAIRETLEENKHLADGENCTLAKLKKVVGAE